MKQLKTSPIVILTLLSLAKAVVAQSVIFTDEIMDYEQSFDAVKVPGGPSGLPWQSGTTFEGIHAVIGETQAETGPELIARNEGGRRTNSVTLYQFVKDGDYSIGFNVGASTGNALIVLELHNQSQATVDSIDIGYTGHQWSAFARGPKTLGLSFCVTDSSDLADANDWISIPSASFRTPSSGTLEDPQEDGMRRVVARQDFVNWGPNQVLWLRWDFSGQPHGALSIDDIHVRGISR